MNTYSYLILKKSKKRMAKGKKEGASKKEVEKKVNKIVEDKTFGVRQ